MGPAAKKSQEIPLSASFRSGRSEQGEASERMVLPAAGQRVEVEGRHGVYMVLSIDAMGEVADLLPMDGIRRVERRVSMAKLSVLREQGDQAELTKQN